ncbi:MAG: ribonuclease HII [Halobacteriaceae archaeon]
MTDAGSAPVDADAGDGAPTPAFGVDEAGKGPVLGAMFAAAVLAPPAVLPDDVDDSKRLSAARREALAADLRTAIAATPGAAIAVASVPPGRIDDPATDMNGLTVRVQAAALRASVARARGGDGGAGGRAVAGVVDAGDTDAARFRRRVAARVQEGAAVHAEHRADERHAHVAAASVVAKVARDAHVAALGRAYGGAPDAVGSGYPSDDVTRAFLERYVDEHGDLPACARRSWATSDDVLAAAEQAGLGEF